MSDIPSIASQKPYAFPHIDFRETIIGPLPFETTWRNTIGVAGEFARGPRGTVRISSRQEFVYLYGESDDPGSVFVQQAMTQGATEFVISRVLPGPEAAEGAIALQSAISPGTIQAVVGPSNRRTTGMRFEMRFISPALILPGEFIGSEVRVSDQSLLTIPNFDGTGYFDFVIAEFIQASSPAYSSVSPASTLELEATTAWSSIQLLRTTSVSFGGAAKPGRRLQLTANPANGTATFAVSASPSDTYLRVLSPSFQVEPGVWGFYVQGRVENVPVSGDLEVVFAPVLSNYYTIGYNYRSGDGALLPPETEVGRFAPVRSDSEKVDWWFTVGTSQSSPQELQVLTFSQQEYKLLNTGIKVAFGRSGATTVQLVPSTRFSIPFVGGSAEIGDMTGNGPAAFLPGDSAEVILTNLRNSILRSASLQPLIRNATVNDLLLPVSLAFESAFESSDANQIQYKLTRNTSVLVPAGAVFTVQGAGITHTVSIWDNSNLLVDGLALDADGEFALAENIVLNSHTQIVIEPALTGTPTITIDTPALTITGAEHTANDSTWVVGDQSDDLLYGSAQVSHYDEWERMVEGQSSLDASSRVLYDGIGNPLVAFEAISPGSYGNNIRITVRPMPPGQFRVEIVDDGADAFNALIKPEAFVLSNYTVDRVTGMYPETLDSKMIRAYFLPVVRAFGAPISPRTFDLTPQRKAPPLLNGTQDLDPSARGSLFLQNMYLQGGTDRPLSSIGERFTEREYRRAIQQLEFEDVAILTLPGVVSTDIRYEGAILDLLGQAERAVPTNGLRIAVLSGPRRVAPSRAQAIVSGLSSNRLVMLTGHCSYLGFANKGVNAIPVDGIYAGIIAMNPPHVSPAAIWNGRTAFGVTTVDTRNDPPSLDILTRSRVEAIYYDQGLRVFKFLNGITTSADPFERYVSVRRMMDQIIMDIYKNLLYIRSQPHTPSLRRRVASSIDAYLRTLLREERIYRYQPTICNESNNTLFDVSRGRMNVRVTVTPVFPADFILIDLIRDLSSEVSIVTQPG